VSHTDRDRWDEKHRTRELGHASPTFRSVLPRLPETGRALDVACGTGPYSALLVERGYTVDGLDISRVGLSIARDRIASAAFRGVQMDLESPALQAGAAWDLVVCTSFLERSVIPSLPSWVRPGGLLYFETFHRGHLAGRPHFRPEWVLERGEIEELFGELEPLTRGETDVRGFVLARRN